MCVGFEEQVIYALPAMSEALCVDRLRVLRSKNKMTDNWIDCQSNCLVLFAGSCTRITGIIGSIVLKK